MTGSPDNPDWDLLPGNPAAFFGLSLPVDRSALRKRYAAFIRVHKPEKDPEAFQRIRAAYEALSRHPGQEDGAPSPADPGEDDADGAGGAAPVPAWEAPRTRIREELEHRLSSESTAEIYRDLKQRDDLEWFHYVALAALADVEEPDQPAAFARWVIEGLRRFPEAPGLEALFDALAHRSMPGPLAIAVLRMARDRLPGSMFCAWTGPIWTRLAGAVPFEVWRPLYDELVADASDLDLEDRQTLLFRALRPLLYSADTVWLDEQIRGLARSGFELRFGDQWALDAFDLLNDYRRIRRRFLDGSRARWQLDRALRDHLERAEDGDAAVIETQQWMVDHVPEVLAAFWKNDRADQAVLAAWSQVTADVAERRGDLLWRFDDEPPRDLFGRALAWRRGIQQALDRRGQGWIHRALYTAQGTIAFMTAVAALAGIIRMFPDSRKDYRPDLDNFVSRSFVFLLVGCAVGVLAASPLRNLIKRFIRYPHERLRFSVYLRHVREPAVRFLRESRATLAQLVRAVGRTGWPGRFLENDPGLGLLSEAWRFLRRVGPGANPPPPE